MASDEGNPQGGTSDNGRGGGSLEIKSVRSPENKKVGTGDSLELPVRTLASVDENIGDGAGDAESSGRNGGVGNNTHSEHGNGVTKGGGIDGHEVVGDVTRGEGTLYGRSRGDIDRQHGESNDDSASRTGEKRTGENSGEGNSDRLTTRSGDGRSQRDVIQELGGGVDDTGQRQGNDSSGGSGGEDSGRGGDKHVEASSGNAEGLKNSTSTTGGELDGDANINAKKAPDGDSGADDGESEEDHSRDFGNLEHGVKERTDDSRTSEGNDSGGSGRGNKGIAKADADGHDEMADSGHDRGDGVSNREDSTRDEERKRTASADSRDSEREKSIAGISGLVGSGGLDGDSKLVDGAGAKSASLGSPDDDGDSTRDTSSAGSPEELLGGTEAMGASESSDIDATETKEAQRDNSAGGLDGAREDTGNTGSGDAESGESNDLSGAMQDNVRTTRVYAKASNGEDGHRGNDTRVGEGTGESIDAGANGVEDDQQGRRSESRLDNSEVLSSAEDDGPVLDEGGTRGTGEAESDSGRGSERSGTEDDAAPSRSHADTRDGGQDNEGGAGHSGSASSGWRASGGIDDKHSDSGEEPDDRDGEGIRNEEPTEDVGDSSDGKDDDNDGGRGEVRLDGGHKLHGGNDSVGVGSESVEQGSGGNDNSDLPSDMGGGGLRDDSVFERSGESAGQGILQDEIREVDGQLKSTEENDKSDDQIREESGTKEVAERTEGNDPGGKGSVDDGLDLESKKKDDLEFKQQTKIQQDLINNLNAAIPTLSGDMQEALLKKFGELGDISANTFLRNSSLILTSDQDGNFSFAPDKLGDAIEQIDASKWAKNELEPIYKRQNRRVLDHTTESVGTIMNIAINVPDRVARELINTGGTRLGLLDVASDTRKAIFRSLDEGRKLGEGADALARRIRNEVPKGRFLNAGSTYRARMIARTETKWSQNESSLVAYELSPDITEVVAFDAQLGPDRSDPDCIARNGRTFTIKQARSEMGREHPNGTLSFAPIVRSGAPRREAAGSRGLDGPLGPIAENQPIASSRPGAQRRSKTLNLPSRNSYANRPQSGADARARIDAVSDNVKPVIDDLMAEGNLLNAEIRELDDALRALNKRNYDTKDDFRRAVNEIANQIAEKQREFALLTDEYYQLNGFINEHIIDIIGHGQPGAKPEWVIKEKFNRDFFGDYAQVEPTFDDFEYLERAAEKFRRMVGDWPDQEKTLDFGIVPGRAYAQNLGGGNSYISIEGTDGTLGTIIHEMGHALETANHGILEESLDFVYQRTKNEKARRLKDIYKGYGYDKREIARVDEFIDAYIGKDYSIDLKSLTKHYGKDFDMDYWGYIESPWDEGRYVGGGELVSMGLEVMSENPIWFANTDPGHFDFIFERVMHRGLLDR